MKTRILLSALIGAVLAGILYPTPDLMTKLTTLAVAFFALLGILFCTMLIGVKKETTRQADGEKTTELPEKTDERPGDSVGNTPM
jgi:hypothetical protein